MKRFGVIAAVVLLAIGLAYGLSPRPVLSAITQIAAPPSRVWAVLVDTGRYSEWNPTMRLTGSLVPGATIKNVEGRNDDQMTFWPTVLVVRPNQELRWLGHYKIPGIFDAEHFFLLQPKGGGTVLAQGESFHGLALWFYDVQRLLPNFVELNKALKARAQAG
jgi:hypothetical protein